MTNAIINGYEINNLAHMTQREFNDAFGFLSTEFRLGEAIFWQESAANWHYYMHCRVDTNEHPQAINCQLWSADAHKLARLYAGTWE